LISLEKNHIVLPAKNTIVQSRWLSLFPVIGITSYLILFLVAMGKYAGGLEEYHLDRHLLCDMMENISTGGHKNDARLIAIIGHTLLFVGMTFFFYILPTIFKKSNINTKIFQYVGMLSMFLFLFLSTGYHDEFVVVAGSLATIAAIPLMLEYAKSSFSYHKFLAILCLLMSIVVFIIYQTKIGIDYLPVFQKVVFAMDSVWVFLVCFEIRSKVSE